MFPRVEVLRLLSNSCCGVGVPSTSMPHSLFEILLSFYTNKTQKGIFLKFWVKRCTEHVFHLLSSQACKWLLPHPSCQCAWQSHRCVDVPWLPGTSSPAADEEMVHLPIRKRVQPASAAIQTFPFQITLCTLVTHLLLTRTMNPVSCSSSKQGVPSPPSHTDSIQDSLF